MVMSRPSFNIVKALGLMALGLGVGSGGTLLLLQWTAKTTPIPKPRTERQTPPKAVLTTALLLQGEPILGSRDAPVTIVEFSDFECPYSKRFHEQVFPSLRREYIDQGLVRFIHKDLPLPFHRQARAAAAAARCAGEENRYWDLYGVLFAQQSCLECKGVVGIAEELNFDLSALQACIQSDVTQALIAANLSEARLHNIGATPTFVIGPTQSNAKHVGEIVEGVMPWPHFKALLDQQLSLQKAR